MQPASSLALVIPALLLVACNPAYAPDLVTASPVTEVPAPVSVTETPSSSQGCYFNWATQPLPELSRQVQAAMDAAGLTGVTALAEAYGENCYDYQTNQIVYFAAMETDFRFSVQVKDLKDRQGLGAMLEEILVALDGLPTESVPGPQPGYIGVNFQAGTDELRLWFRVSEWRSARMAGLHGEMLLDGLQNK